MKTSHLVIGLLIAAGALYYCLHNISIPELIASFTNVEWIYLIPFLLLLCVQYYMRAVRWKYLVHPIKEVSSNRLVGPIFIGFMCNMLPARLGEPIRAYVLSQQEKVPFTACFGSVFIERLFDLLFLGLSFVVCLFFFPDAFVPQSMGENQAIVDSIKGFGVTIFLAFIFVLFFSYSLVHWHYKTVILVHKCLFFLPENWRNKIEDLIKTFSTGLEILKSKEDTAKVVALSGILWVLFPLSFLPVYWMYGIDLPLYTVFVLNIMICAFITLFPTPAFIGSLQAGVVFTLSSVFGIDPVISNSMGMVVWFVGFAFVLAGGVFFLIKGKLSLSALVKEGTEKH